MRPHAPAATLRSARRQNTEVLRPLGMTSTVLDLDLARKREHATPHSRTLSFETRPLATETERGVDSVMPAGSAWSNVRDLSRWMLLELNDGRIDGKQVVSEANLLERRKPRVKISAKQWYALALMGDESRGLLSFGHGGRAQGRVRRAPDLMTGPPFAGLAFWPQTIDGKPALLFETAQQKYVFERSPATRR
jgi:CubicO group peptidase (beta-lactamase class C family)